MTLNRYLVRWTIDVDAETPEAAARQALATQRNPDSWSTVFDVFDAEGNLFATIDVDETPSPTADTNLLE